MSVTLSPLPFMVRPTPGVAWRERETSVCGIRARRCVSRSHVIASDDDDDDDDDTEEKGDDEDADETIGIEPLTVEDDDFFDENDFDDDFDDDFEEEYEELEADFKNDDDEKIPLKEVKDDEEIELDEGDF
ncbi:MAG: hypothetical protein QM811_20425 [Pirellulales bacterium]